MTAKFATQVGTDVLISPFLPIDQHEHDLVGIERIKIVKPDGRVVEKDIEFGRAFGAPDVYVLLILNTQTDEIPIGSQLCMRKSSDHA